MDGPLELSCECGVVHRVDVALLGKQVRCTTCARVLTVRDAGAEEEPEEEEEARPRRRKRRRARAPVRNRTQDQTRLVMALVSCAIAGAGSVFALQRGPGGRSARESVWVEHASPHGLSIRFPHPPSEAPVQQRANREGDACEFRSASVNEDGRILYRLDSVKNLAGEFADDPETMFAATRTAMLDASGGTAQERGRRSLTLGGHPGVAYRIALHSRGQAETIHVRQFVVGGRLSVMASVTVGGDEQAAAALVDAFFESLRLTR
jgi:hypothetical protein